MSRQVRASKRLYGGLIWPLVMVLTLTGCALQLPGAASRGTPTPQPTKSVPAGTIKELGLNLPGYISDIVFDRTGNIWGAQQTKFERISETGELKTFIFPQLAQLVDRLAPGSDGNLWFIGRPGPTKSPTQNQSIGYITPDGQLKNFLFPYGSLSVTAAPITRLIAGSDGKMWYGRAGSRGLTANGSYANASLGWIDHNGNKREFIVPGSDSDVGAMYHASDGALWFTVVQYSTHINYRTNPVTIDVQAIGGTIGYITTSGSMHTFKSPVAHSTPGAIWRGPDGTMWFTEAKILNGNGLGASTTWRIGADGKMSELSGTVGAVGAGVLIGPDGSSWFIDYAQNAIGRLTADGNVYEFTIPTAKASPYSLVAGKDGNLWFSEYGAGKIGRITPTGTITEFTIPTPGAQPGSLVPGPDGNLWFSEIFSSGSDSLGDIGYVTV